MRPNITSVVVAMLLLGSMAHSQLPVEYFAGNKKATVDGMFFKFFKKENNENSKVLFFNRSRASVDYGITSTNNLPAFGITQAFSYNTEALRGFAPVGVVQLLGRGVYAKAGTQFAKLRENWMVFTWCVVELKAKPSIDYFLLMRYTPRLSEHWKWFIQLESVNAFTTLENQKHSFIQRARLGLSRNAWQFGIGTDWNELWHPESTLSYTQNTGVFVRYEFK